MYEISEIKELRKKLGMTQAQLAYESGVSQSLIAKIEANMIDPSFTKCKKLFAALENESNKVKVTAQEMMNKKILSVKPKDSLKSAIFKMKKYEISQMPVFFNKNVVGLISESSLVEILVNSDGKNYKNVEDVMSDPPPVVSTETPHTAISSFLKYFGLVLVNNKGKYVGLITRSDFIRNLYKK
ncbi:CBS domain-containing protein [Candidatus Woesearchaeota archaeon]|nr:CBS domain-containing protein [Candidatus Woesearchaeota archaeon]